MRKYRRICFIPLFGSIIYFLIITHYLKKIKKSKDGHPVRYLFMMGLLGAVGIFLSILLMSLIPIVRYKSLFFQIIVLPICLLVAWPLVTIPLIEYEKRADKLILDSEKSKTTESD